MLTVILGAIVAIILVAGLFTRDYAFRNDVAWRKDGPGIEFGKFGIAFTDAGVPVDLLAPERGMTIELAFERAVSDADGFRFVAVFRADDAASQLLIAQYEDWLVVMNGDDYDHRRRVPRATAELDAPPGETIHVVFASDSRGTTLYLNGEPRVHRDDLVMRIPHGKKGTRLVMGNSPDGHHPWSGTILGLAVYGEALSPGTVRAQYSAWREAGRIGVPEGKRPALLYRFDEGSGPSAADHSGSGLDLSFPPRSSASERAVLAWRSPFSDQSPSLAGDMALNLAGFVPFGLVLALLLNRWFKRRYVFFVSALAGLLLSLGIEVAQSWIPTRNSSLLDLILNFAGAAIGAGLGLLWAAGSSARHSRD